MDHAGEGQLLAYLDGELSAAERAAVSAHLAACTACAEELSVLEEASRQFAASLRLLDSVAPAPTPVEAVLARAKAERVAAVRRTLLRAAGIVLFLAAGGAAAMPGSPLRQWVQAAWERRAELFGGERQGQAPPAVAPEPAGVDATPVDGRIHISLVDLPEGAEVRIRLVDSPVAWVEVPTGGDRPVRFVRGAGRVEVSGGGAGVVRVDLPRGVADARVEVDGELRVFKDGDTLRFAGSGEGVGGGEATLRIAR